MIRSMTGYGKAEALLDGGKLTIEIRTLNSKSADINLKTQLFPKDKELGVRQKIAQLLQRGTIDVFLTWEPNAAENAKTINGDLVAAYFRQIRDIYAQCAKDGVLLGGAPSDALTLASVLRFPDVLDVKKTDIITDDNWPQVDAAIDAALQAVDTYRREEGTVLYADVASRVQKILAIYDEVEAFEGERIETVKARLMKNLEELQQKPDPNRFEQELIFYLEKYDINEEKVRLRQHCQYFMDTIDGEPYPGKKLGFIIQEMGREINTTGSKANHAGIQQCVVRMKDELEKIREQSMNIL
ncbi:MAG: YicC family protein [Bacteroidales bacterium]|nr:YicC family protein [Bacteroidales bacterium]